MVTGPVSPRGGFSLIEIMVSTALSAVVMLGTGALLTQSVSQQIQIESIAEHEDLRTIVRKSLIDSNPAQCSERVRLVGDVFDITLAASNTGVPLSIENMSTFPGGLKAGTDSNFGRVKSLQFANAQKIYEAPASGLSPAKSIYQGVLYLSGEIKKGAKQDQVPVGVLSLVINADSMTLSGCAEPVDPLQTQCEAFGENLIFNPETGTCMAAVVARAEPACADGERAYTDNNGLLRCLPITKGNACGDRADGRKRFPSGTYLGQLECGGTAVANVIREACGKFQSKFVNILRCEIEKGLVPSLGDEECIEKYGGWRGVGPECSRPIIEDFVPAQGPPPELPPEPIPTGGDCRCGDKIIKNGEKCMTCYKGSNWNFVGNWDLEVYLDGYIRRSYTCNDGGLKANWYDADLPSTTYPGGIYGQFSTTPCSEDER